MATPYTAALPPDTDLTNGCTIQFVAIDPVSGNAVSGVTVANVSIYADTTGNAGLEPLGPYMLVPGPGA
jgi:hypothetical protein